MDTNKLIAGPLAMGLQSQLAKTIAMTSKIMQQQTEIAQELQKASSEAALASSNAVLYSETELSRVESKDATTYFAAGGTDIAALTLPIGHRMYREGTFGSIAPGELNEDKEASTQISYLKNTLQNPEKAEAYSGAKDPAVMKQVSDEELNSLRNKPSKEYNENDIENLKKLKALRGASLKNDPIKRGNLYDDIEKKLNKEEDAVQTRRSRFENETEQTGRYLTQVGTAVSQFAQGGTKLAAAAARKDQAKADSYKSIYDYAASNQRGAADTAQQAFQNTSQAYEAQIREGAAIARANAAA